MRISTKYFRQMENVENDLESEEWPGNYTRDYYLTDEADAYNVYEQLPKFNVESGEMMIFDPAIDFSDSKKGKDTPFRGRE